MAAKEPDAAFIAEAQEALIDEDYTKALDLYDVMIEGYPKYVPGWVHRSAVNLKLGRAADALGDAAKAVKLDDRNPKAHMRKGMAFFELGEPAPAKMCFEKGAELEGVRAKYETWIAKCDDLLAGNGSPKDPTPESAKPETSTALEAPVQTPRYKHQWYQSLSHVTLEVLAKKVNPADATIVIESGRVTVTINDDRAPDDPYVLDLNLFGKVLPKDCKTSIGAAKVEVRLKKAEAAQWGDIVAGAGGASGATTSVTTPAAAPPARPADSSAKAAQKKTVTDWDKLEKELE